MDDTRKAKILLEYDNLYNYMSDFYLYYGSEPEEWIYSKAERLLKDRFERWQIKEEWKNSKVIAEFLEDGNTRRDILHATWKEAYEENFEDILEEIAIEQVSHHFEGDEDFISPVREYLRPYLKSVIL
jgi:hypothetical protein